MSSLIKILLNAYLTKYFVTTQKLYINNTFISSGHFFSRLICTSQAVTTLGVSKDTHASIIPTMILVDSVEQVSIRIF